jgi:hypothetical protein
VLPRATTLATIQVAQTSVWDDPRAIRITD